MENIYKISDIIDSYISGDWGNDCKTNETPYPVYCVRGADIVPISNSKYNDIPLRYVSMRSFQTRCLQEGDIIIEKSGGSPTQSTGRVVYVSKELLATKNNIVCSNFCTAFRVKKIGMPTTSFYTFRMCIILEYFSILKARLPV